jgi:hypothetical protein
VGTPGRGRPPYPEDDPNLNRLRQDLARYNPDPDPLNKITSILRP